MIDYTHDVDVQHMEECAERTYTAQEIAEEHGIKAVTVRTRWFDWLLKVAPEPLLKDEKQFTHLAYTLFADFAHVHHSERRAWVREQKEHLASEWGNVGITDCEVMPDNVGGTLALLSSNLTAQQADITLQLTEVNQFIDGMNAADADLSEAEAQQAITRGTQRAIAEFKLEEQAKARVKHELHQRRINGGAQS